MASGEVAQIGQAADSPFTTRELRHLDEALSTADQVTGLNFSIYLGELEEPARAAAEKLHQQTRAPQTGVLIALSPDQRVLEIVIGSAARRRISDHDAKLAVFSMTASFSVGDLAGGLLVGIDQLASHAGRA
ncbi:MULTISPECIES: DUF5130 family protein [Actinoplanes]|uniref:DUF5130 family protein n=1 Tax=Actinoplanes TaxID=1865 RepID=UPI0005F28D33|nr:MULTISPECIES: DUF5130 family protein [Actinoplanes]GLY01430.1 hypothetical protein Acsp01_18090 [Actinoplanes sp. NBRC 101535]